MFNRRSNRQSLVASELFQMPLYFVIRRDVDNAEDIMQRIDSVLARESE